MPFQREELEKLLNRENISERELANEICKLTNNSYEIHISHQSIRSWIKGKSEPKTESIDILYTYAHIKGYDDLDLYYPPNKDN